MIKDNFQHQIFFGFLKKNVHTPLVPQITYIQYTIYIAKPFITYYNKILISQNITCISGRSR